MEKINWKDAIRQADEQIEKLEKLKLNESPAEKTELADAKNVNEVLDSAIAKTDKMLELLDRSI